MGCGGVKKVDKAQKRQEAKITVRDLRDAITNMGVLEPKNQILLKSEVSGTVTRLQVTEGTQVRKGDPILVIDPRPYENAKEKLLLQRKKLELETSILLREMEKDSALNAEGAVSQRQLLDQRDRLSLKQIQLNEVDIDIKDVSEKLEKSLLTAPISGTLISLDTKVGEIIVSATTGYSQGTTIGTLANTDSMQVLCNVNEVDYHTITPATPVNVFLESDPAARAPGRISFISKSAKLQEGRAVRSFEIRVDVLKMHPKMVPGINVTVEFVLLDKPKVHVLPAHFIRVPEGKENKEAVVLVKKADGKTEERALKTGVTDFKFTEVISGLSPEETVVEPQDDKSDAR